MALCIFKITILSAFSLPHICKNFFYIDNISYKEVPTMFERKMKIQLDAAERKIIVESLIELKNDLIRQGRYTDAVDELLIKVANVK